MARFSGSEVSFDPQALQAAGMSSNYSSAASAVDLATGFKSMREKAPRFDQLSAEAMKNQAAENIAATEAEAGTAGDALTAFGMTKATLLSAQGNIEAAKEAGKAQERGQQWGALGGVLSTGLKLLAGPAGFAGSAGAGAAGSAAAGLFS